MSFTRISKRLAGFRGNFTTYKRIGKTANFVSTTPCVMNPHTLNFERETITYKEAVTRGYEPFYIQRDA